jgi:hypothetical protein
MSAHGALAALARAVRSKCAYQYAHEEHQMFGLGIIGTIILIIIVLWLLGVIG